MIGADPGRPVATIKEGGVAGWADGGWEERWRVYGGWVGAWKWVCSTASHGEERRWRRPQWCTTARGGCGLVHDEVTAPELADGGGRSHCLRSCQPLEGGR